MTKVIIVQTAFLGDVLLTLPLCAGVKRTIPEAHVTLVTTPAAAGMVRDLDAVDDVVVFDKRGEHRSLREQRNLAFSLSVDDDTIVLVAHKSWRTALFVRHIRASKVVAFADSPSRWFATDSVAIPSGLHAAERYILLLRPIIPHNARIPRLVECLPIRFQNQAHGQVSGSGQAHVVLAPGAAWKTKQWPVQYFRALAQRLVHEGKIVSVIGDASVTDVASGIAGVNNLAGSTTMRQAAEVVAAATILVANDSAPVHLASLQNTPTIAIFGPTIPEFGFGPFGSNAIVVQNDALRCRPCSDHGTQECPLGTHECMISVTVDEVYDRIQYLLHAHDENRHATATK